MNYTETTTTSYGGRLGKSIKGIGVGFFLIIGMVGLLWWNEGRTINTTIGLNEAQDQTINGVTESIDSSLEGKLVYNTGKVQTDTIHVDEEFGISQQSIKLIRSVEMYQWKENSSTKNKDNLGGSQTSTTTYTYETVWSDSQLNSDNYKEPGHDNPKNWSFKKKTYVSDNVAIGKLKLSDAFVSQLNEKEQIPLDGEKLQAIEKNISNIKLDQNYFYIGTGNNTQPSVGDLRISFYSVNPADISVIGVQKGETLVPYKSSTETNVALLQYGTVELESMYETAHSDNMFLAWIIRAVGLLLMFIGFRLLLGLVDALAKIIPFLGSIVSIGTGIIAFLLTVIVGLGTIAIAWLYVRPLIGGAVIILIVGVIALIIKYKKSKNTISDESQLGYID